QRESLVKRATLEFKAAVEKVTGVSIGRPFTADEVLELKKYCGYDALCRSTAHSFMILLSLQLLLSPYPSSAHSMTWLDLRKVKTFFAEKGLKLMSVGE